MQHYAIQERITETTTEIKVQVMLSGLVPGLEGPEAESVPGPLSSTHKQYPYFHFSLYPHPYQPVHPSLS